MSAWMLSDAHADFIATAYLKFIDRGADPQKIGQQLLRENCRSLAALYEERHGIDTEALAQAAAYRYQPWRANMDPQNVSKQARCADYQCCEHGDAWTESASGQLIAALIDCTGGREAPLSDFYPWGIDEHPEHAAAPQPEALPPAVRPADPSAAAQLIQLRAAAPKRANSGAVIVAQFSATGLDLFDHAQQPDLLRTLH